MLPKPMFYVKYLRKKDFPRPNIRLKKTALETHTNRLGVITNSRYMSIMGIIRL